jgi:hypothetical protein
MACRTGKSKGRGTAMTEMNKIDDRLILVLVMNVSFLLDALRSDEALLDHTKERLGGIKYTLEEILAEMKKNLGLTI